MRKRPGTRWPRTPGQCRWSGWSAAGCWSARSGRLPARWPRTPQPTSSSGRWRSSWRPLRWATTPPFRPVGSLPLFTAFPCGFTAATVPRPSRVCLLGWSAREPVDRPLSHTHRTALPTRPRPLWCRPSRPRGWWMRGRSARPKPRRCSHGLQLQSLWRITNAAVS